MAKDLSDPQTVGVQGFGIGGDAGSYALFGSEESVRLPEEKTTAGLQAGLGNVFQNEGASFAQLAGSTALDALLPTAGDAVSQQSYLQSGTAGLSEPNTTGLGAPAAGDVPERDVFGGGRDPEAPGGTGLAGLVASENDGAGTLGSAYDAPAFGAWGSLTDTPPSRHDAFSTFSRDVGPMAGGEAGSVQKTGEKTATGVQAGFGGAFPNEGAAAGSTALEALRSAAHEAAVARGRAEPAPAPGNEIVSLSMALPTDDLFSQQWHLQNNTAGLLDLNVTEVWDGTGQTYTGAGVDVAVIDDAVERDHPDLNDNISTLKDWDFADNDTEPSGVDGNNHGTAVAGIIASENDGTGTVGVAYDATIFGFRVKSNGTLPTLYDEFLTQLRDALQNASGEAAVSGVNRTADVVNMSNGTQINSNFYSRDVPTQSLPGEVVSAFEYGAENGRGGLGTIFVKSAGNGRGSDHDANGSEWNATRYSISVAAVDQDGSVTAYSTEGANLFVSAFGSPVPGTVVTTDRQGAEGYNSGANPDYTFAFNGTSAAAPMVSGVVALMLEANPSLGWRDVQDILVYSARHVGSDVGAGVTGSEENAWFFNGAGNWNGGGLHFSKDYGFGLVDAHAAVRLAETWNGTAQTSANDALYNTDLIDTTVTLSGNSASYNFTPTAMFAETIEVQLTSSHTWIGDMNIVLTSPSGTSINLIKDNYGGSADMSNDTYTWSTNAFWGEDSSGTWTVTLTDEFTADTWTITDMQINVWGDSSANDTVNADDRIVITDEFSDYAGASGHSTALAPVGSNRGTLNTAAVTSGSLIDLLAGTGTIDGVAVTLTDFSEIHGGDGDDTITGNNVTDLISGMRGNDELTGGAGNETVLGGAGDDLLIDLNNNTGDVFDGGDGIDTFRSDLTWIDSVIFHMIDERIYVSAGGTQRAAFRNVENLIIGGAADVVGDGEDNDIFITDTEAGYGDNPHSNTIEGGGGNDTIDTGLGNDTIDGGSGADHMIGGAGDDFYIVDDAGDVVTEASGEGDDTVESSVSYDIRGTFVERLVLTGSADLTGTGNSLANTITGNSGNNTIFGNNGNDTIDGGTGADRMSGGSGNDFFIVDNAGDIVIETSGNGDDTVESALSYNMGGTFVERLVLTGSADLTGTGNSLANTITGNSGQNTITGGTGDDTIEGGAGRDDVYGGAEDDLLRVTDAAHVVSGETYDGGDGTGDVLQINGGGTFDFSASTVSGIEEILFGSADSRTAIFEASVASAGLSANALLIDAYGIAGVADVVRFMASGDATLAGLSFADWRTADDGVELIGGAAAQTLIGSSVNDMIEAGGGDDTVTGGAGRDDVYGGAEDDLLRVTDAAHVVSGETYDGGDGTGDVLQINGGGTFDFSASTVSGIEEILFGSADSRTAIFDASVASAGLSANALLIDAYGIAGVADVVRFMASGDATLAGLSFADWRTADDGVELIGGAAAQTLIGSSVNDMIEAGGGDDTVTGGAGADKFVFGLNDGSNVVTDFSDIDAIVLQDTGTVIIGYDGPDSLVTYSNGGDTTTILVEDYHVTALDFEL
ncbi:S8 family serine peptidase [Salipiger abyssi]|uniref:S8 family serine peptidase n=1 Tax=Salipiger abyssi TaxID=1250539 RepID=UPI001A8D45C0|nr:S8 family serine peptidase [Salipiger abyssi]MBN9889837.1 S8 family serine peptidase [Salipiger abyssi]